MMLINSCNFRIDVVSTETYAFLLRKLLTDFEALNSIYRQI